MAQTTYQYDNLPQLPDARVHILFSKWHQQYSQSMIKYCQDVLTQAGIHQIHIHQAPGCLELPLMAKTLTQLSDKPDAVITFGVIIKGDTAHYDIVTQQSSEGLAQVALETGVPMINEILPVEDIAHVIARTGDNDQNKGIEAALAAIEMIHWRAQLESNV